MTPDDWFQPLYFFSMFFVCMFFSWPNWEVQFKNARQMCPSTWSVATSTGRSSNSGVGRHRSKESEGVFGVVFGK